MCRSVSVQEQEQEHVHVCVCVSFSDGSQCWHWVRVWQKMARMAMVNSAPAQ